jgi:hypothetical protein
VDDELRRSHDLSIGTLDLHAANEETYRRHNLALFGAVSKVSGRRFVVDSSKKHYRLDRLLRIRDLDVRIVHLVREPGGVVYSHVRKTGDTSVRSGLGFSYLRGEVRLLRMLRGRRYQVVHYEDLAADPDAALGQLMCSLGLPFEVTQLDPSKRQHHSVGGNPMRFTTRGPIAPDLEWKTNLSTARKMVINAVTLPVRQPLLARLVESTGSVTRSGRGVRPF